MTREVGKKQSLGYPGLHFYCKNYILKDLLALSKWI
jgi:hypothetical protein